MSVERDVERGRGLAGQAADRQAVAAVGGHRDVEHRVAQAEHVERVVAGLRRVGGQHEDAVVLVADAELAGRADHPVGDVAVGLARADREAAGQHGAGQRDHDQVADGEVARAADDAARLAPRRRRPGTSGSSCRSSAARPSNDSTRPTTSGPAMPSAPDSTPSTSMPTRISASASARGSMPGRQVDVLGQPGDGCLHDFHPEGGGEPDVALDDVAHVRDVVAEHQRPLDAHAEREPAVALGVDAAGGQHARVDHAAAAPLDPALAAARAARAGRGCRPTRRGRRSRAGPSRRSAR